MRPNIQNYVIMRWNILSQPLGSACPAGCPTKKEIPIAIPLVLAAASVASSIYGGAKSSQANRQAQARLDAERTATEAERRRKKYESWTSTASGQNTMRMLRDMADREFKRNRGAAAVGGATDAAVAQEKEAQNLKQAEVIAQAVASHEDKKDQVDATYRQQLQAITQQQIAAEQAKGQAIAQAASGVSSGLMQGAAATFGGTKYGQQLMGTGSPAGQGVTPASGSTTSQLQDMGSSPDIDRQMAMQHYLGYQNNYSKLLNNGDFLRFIYTGR